MKKWTVSKQQLKSDPAYNSKLVSKFINCMIWDGKKSIAQRIFYDAMAIIRRSSVVVDSRIEARGSSSDKRASSPASKDERRGPNELEVFEKAVNNVKPLLEVRSRRIGGASYQVPMQVSPKRQQSLAFRWIIQSARSKKGKPMCSALADELIDAYNGHGGAMTTRENIHRMAEANKAFAHFAW
ncbi:MAG: 30S ribosomal protein S7 [Phycisphaerae bacterium]